MTGENSSGDTQCKFPHLPQGRLLSSITGLFYPMTSSLMAEILDNTQKHSSATFRTWLARSVGLNETSYTGKASLCLLRNLLHCKGKSVSTLCILFPLHFFVFKQTVPHLTGEVNVEQVLSRSGQLSEFNVDPDSLSDMVSIMINKHAWTKQTFSRTQMGELNLKEIGCWARCTHNYEFYVPVVLTIMSKP
jgi:hypothetical protein